MATVENFKVDGLKKLTADLKKIEAKTGIKVLRKAGRKAMVPVVVAMKVGAGKDRGDLGNSMGIRVRTGSRSNKSRALTIQAGTVKKSTGRGDNKREFSSVNQKAIAQEYGTKQQQAKPFIRPAMDNNKNKVLEILKTEFKNELEKVHG